MWLSECLLETNPVGLWWEGWQGERQRSGGGELQSRLRGSSYQELAEEGKIEGGVVDCDITGSCVWTLGPHLGVLFWENFKRWGLPVSVDYWEEVRMYRSLPLQSWGPLPCFASPPWWTVSLELKTGIYCFSLHFLSRFCHCDLKKQKQKRIYIEECLVLSKFTSLRWVAFIAVMGCMQPMDQRFYI